MNNETTTSKSSKSSTKTNDKVTILKTPLRYNYIFNTLQNNKQSHKNNNKFKEFTFIITPKQIIIIPAINYITYNTSTNIE